MNTTPHCCEHSWREARQAAWKSAQAKSQCLCDPHIEYCNQCFPPEFRPGGEWDQYKPSAPQPPAGEPAAVEALRELLQPALILAEEEWGGYVHRECNTNGHVALMKLRELDKRLAALGGDRG